MNAHINHDLAQAIVSNCQATNTVPQHGGAQYNDYTAINATLDSLIEPAKRELHVRLLGTMQELLWHLQPLPLLASTFMNTLDGLTTVAGKALLVPVPKVAPS